MKMVKVVYKEGILYTLTFIDDITSMIVSCLNNLMLQDGMHFKQNRSHSLVRPVQRSPCWDFQEKNPKASERIRVLTKINKDQTSRFLKAFWMWPPKQIQNADLPIWPVALYNVVATSICVLVIKIETMERKINNWMVKSAKNQWAFPIRW